MMTWYQLAAQVFCTIYLVYEGFARPTRRQALGILDVGAIGKQREMALPLATAALLGAGLTLLAGPDLPAAAGFAYFAVLAGLYLSRNRETQLLHILQLLDSLNKQITAGAGFFEALGTVQEVLPEGPIRAATIASLEHHADRRTITESLKPFARLGGHAAELAADVCAAGSGLAIVVLRLKNRVSRHWDLRAGRRVRRDRVAQLHPGLRMAALASAFVTLVTTGNVNLVVFGMFGLAIVKQISIPSRSFRVAVLGGSLVAVILAVSAGPASSKKVSVKIRTYDPAPLFLPRLERLPPLLPEGEETHDIIEMSALPRPDKPVIAQCRISTGIPDGWVHIRETPGTDGRVISYAAESERFFRSGLIKNWISVRHADGRSGWIYGAYCAP